VARFSKVKKACEKREAVVTPPKRGSHWKVKREGQRSFPLPAHNGSKSEITDHYIRALWRNFGCVDWDSRADL